MAWLARSFIFNTFFFFEKWRKTFFVLLRVSVVTLRVKVELSSNMTSSSIGVASNLIWFSSTLMIGSLMVEYNSRFNSQSSRLPNLLSLVLNLRVRMMKHGGCLVERSPNGALNTGQEMQLKIQKT